MPFVGCGIVCWTGCSRKLGVSARQGLAFRKGPVECGYIYMRGHQPYEAIPRGSLRKQHPRRPRYRPLAPSISALRSHLLRMAVPSCLIFWRGHILPSLVLVVSEESPLLCRRPGLACSLECSCLNTFSTTRCYIALVPDCPRVIRNQRDHNLRRFFRSFCIERPIFRPVGRGTFVRFDLPP